MSSDVKLYPVDQQTKLAFARVCKEAGLSPKEVLTLFTHAVVNQGVVPTYIRSEQAETYHFDNKPVFQGESANQDDLDNFESQCRFINELMGT